MGTFAEGSPRRPFRFKLPKRWFPALNMSLFLQWEQRLLHERFTQETARRD